MGTGTARAGAWALLIAAAASIAGCGGDDAAAVHVPARVPSRGSQWFGPGHVQIDAASRSSLGLRDTAIVAAEERPRRIADASVEDPALLAYELRELAASQTASAAQDSGAGERWRAQAEAVGAEWGEWVMRMSDANRAQLLEDLKAGRYALIEVPMPAGIAIEDPLDVAVEFDPRRVGRPVQASEAVSRSDANHVPTLLALVEVTGRPPLPGDALRAYVPTGAAATQGVRLPRAAVFEQGAHHWAWVAAGDDRYERREVEGAAVPGGVFVTDRFRAGERVVVAGVDALEAFVATLHQ